MLPWKKTAQNVKLAPSEILILSDRLQPQPNPAAKEVLLSLKKNEAA
jgi:hypothetical protein